MPDNEPVYHKLKRALRLERAFRLIWQTAPGWTLASLALTLLQGALPLLALYLMKLIVDAVTGGITSPDKWAAFGKVGLWIGLAGVVALASALCRTLSDLVSETLSQTVTDRVFDTLHAKSVEVDLEHYENPQYYDILHRAQNQAPFRPTSIVTGLVQAVQNTISLLAIAGLLLSFHWSILVTLLIASVPGVLVRLRYSGMMYRWQRDRTPTERKSWYYHWMLTDSGHAKEVRLFDLGGLFVRRFRELRSLFRRERLSIATHRSLADLAAQTVATVAIYGTYLFVGYRTLQGGITLGGFVMYFQAFQTGLNCLRLVMSSLASLYEDNLFLANYYEFVDLKPRMKVPAHPQSVPRPMRSGIVFDGVSFEYPGTNKRVLEDVCLKIAPGRVVALVGENGSGKTTLTKLLCRLYDPTIGRITVDGIDLRELDTVALRREISVIFQDYARYNLTARENIWFGDIALPPQDDRIVGAARHAGADALIARLPAGYDTTLGHWFEEGKELSVGEWQKVALARAFLRDVQVVVLDEPTSAMDARAEYEVFQRFRQLVQGRAAVLISHRFSTVRMADHIYVLGSGRIVEDGSHDELIRCNGMYAKLFEMQAQSYR